MEKLQWRKPQPTSAFVVPASASHVLIVGSVLWLYRIHNAVHSERPVLKSSEKQIDEQMQPKQVRSSCEAGCRVLPQDTHSRVRTNVDCPAVDTPHRLNMLSSSCCALHIGEVPNVH